MNRRIVAGVASATVALAALAGCTTAPHENPADPAETTAPDFNIKTGETIEVAGVPDSWGAATVLEGSNMRSLPVIVEFTVTGADLSVYQEFMHERGCVQVEDLTPDGIKLLGIEAAPGDKAPFEDRPNDRREAELLCETFEGRSADFDVMDDRQAAALDGPLTIDAHVHADQVVIGDE